MLYLNKQVETGHLTHEQMKAMMCEYAHKVTAASKKISIKK
jgi:hypothetical protein